MVCTDEIVISKIAETAMRIRPTLADHVGLGLHAIKAIEAAGYKPTVGLRTAVKKRIKELEAIARRARSAKTEMSGGNLGFDGRITTIKTFLAKRFHGQEVKYTNQELTRLVSDYLKSTSWRDAAEDIVAELRAQWTQKGVATRALKAARRKKRETAQALANKQLGFDF